MKGDAKESGGVDRQKTGRRGNDVADSARGVQTEDEVRAAARSWRWADSERFFCRFTLSFLFFS